MTRLRRRSIGAAVRKLHARALRACADDWSARGVRERAVCEPLRERSVSTVSLRSVSRPERDDAVEATFCCRAGLQTARSRVPCARHN
eukprot:9382672-Lingulodinium_polyedra.AAC.1